MLRSPKVATPATAATLVVPVRPVPLYNDTVTTPVKSVATAPNASSAATCTAGVMGTPTVVVDGCTVNASCVAAPASPELGGSPDIALIGVIVAPLSSNTVHPGRGFRRR